MQQIMINNLEFKRELKELLIKYGIEGFGITASACSDWAGIYEERIVFYDKKEKELLSFEGSGIELKQLTTEERDETDNNISV